MARLNISVPFEEKDYARSAGAKWDKDTKTWYIPDTSNVNLDDFSQWINESKSHQIKTITNEPDYLIDDRGRKWVTMSNALIRATHGLTLSEKRIVCIALSKLDPTHSIKFGEVPTTRITAEEYAELAGCNLPTAYEAIQDAAKILYERTIKFFEPAHRRKGKEITMTEVNMRWVGQVHYQKGEGWAELYWWPKLLPHLIGLKKQFTQYQLKQGVALRSEYSWRLLELLTRFQSTGWAEYTIEDFCASFGATEKQASNFSRIRIRMIEPAVKELTEKDNWIINWKPIKAGRRVAKIRFEFERNAQGKLFK